MVHAGATGNTALEIKKALCSTDTTTATVRPYILKTETIDDSAIISVRAIAVSNQERLTPFPLSIQPECS